LFTFSGRNPQGLATLSLGKIDLFSFGSESPREISVKGWSNLDSVSWTADGKHVFASVRMLKGTILLRVDFQGQALVLFGSRRRPRILRGSIIGRSPCGASRLDVKQQHLDDGEFLECSRALPAPCGNPK
jgi:hypothetical protein